MSALGNQKLLVIPVEFKGEREFNEEDLTRIQKVSLPITYRQVKEKLLFCTRIL